MTSGVRTILNQFSWLAGEKVLTLVSASIVSILIARHLGPAEFGILSYITSLAAIALAVGQLGLSGIVTRDLVLHPEEEEATLGTVSVLTVGAMLLITALVAVWSYYSPTLDGRIKYLQIIVVATCTLRRFEFLESWFVVHKKVGGFAIARTAVAFVFAIVRVVLLLRGAELEVFVWTVAAEYVAVGLRSLLAYRVASGNPVNWSFRFAIVRRLIKQSWPLMISGVLAIIYLRIDQLMVAEMYSVSEAGVYAAAARLSELWFFIPTVFMTAAFPALLHMRAASTSRYAETCQNLLDILCAAGMAVAVVMSLAAPWIIHLLFGPAYAGATAILTVHVWAGVFISMRAFLSKWLIAEQLSIFSLITHAGGAIVNIGLNLVLIPRYGGLGAAIATLAAYATAGYFALVLHSKTRPVFYAMSKAFLFPLRIKDLHNTAVASLRR